MVSHSESRGEFTVTLGKAYLMQCATILRDDERFAFDSLRDVCGVDNARPGDRFEVVYHLYSLRHGKRVRLKVRVQENEPEVPTVTSVWPAANWYERETFDMFGIRFGGHPDMRRIYMPPEFEYYPLRKDFPLMGVPDSLPLPRKKSH